MPSISLIGDTGVIGTILKHQYNFDHLYNSTNINAITNTTVDTIICAAPSGDRLWVAKNQQQDIGNIVSLVDTLKTVTVDKFVLISSVDAVLYPESAYGANRKLLEELIKEQFPNYYILRLCTLISNNIKKNILYDLKNNVFVDCININSTLQWYPLSNLKNDIEHVIKNTIREINLVSEPIQNGEIIDNFCSNNTIGTNPLPAKHYNLTPTYFSKDVIFKEISNYLK